MMPPQRSLKLSPKRGCESLKAVGEGRHQTLQETLSYLATLPMTSWFQGGKGAVFRSGHTAWNMAGKQLNPTVRAKRKAMTLWLVKEIKAKTSAGAECRSIPTQVWSAGFLKHTAQEKGSDVIKRHLTGVP